MTVNKNVKNLWKLTSNTAMAMKDMRGMQNSIDNLKEIVEEMRREMKIREASRCIPLIFSYILIYFSKSELNKVLRGLPTYSL